MKYDLNQVCFNPFVFALLALSSLISTSAHAKPHPFDAEDLVNMVRLSAPSISPDDESVVYVVRSTDIEANKGRTDLWLTNIKSKKAVQLTKHLASDHSPKWSSKGKTIYFISSRSESSQIWSIDLNNNNTLKQVTDFPIDITSFKLSQDSKKILFSADVFPACNNLQCTADKLGLQNSEKTTGLVYDKMFVRHWDHWIQKTQSQLFAVELKKGAVKQSTVIPVSKSVNANVPSDPFGGDEEYNFSADASKVYFSARLQNANEPMSTNFDLYSVSLDSPGKAILITGKNAALDTQPILSHNGKYLAYLAMERPGFESDQMQVVLKELAS